MPLSIFVNSDAEVGAEGRGCVNDHLRPSIRRTLLLCDVTVCRIEKILRCRTTRLQLLVIYRSAMPILRMCG
jgi:hypothetical protein